MILKLIERMAFFSTVEVNDLRLQYLLLKPNRTLKFLEPLKMVEQTLAAVDLQTERSG